MTQTSRNNGRGAMARRCSRARESRSRGRAISRECKLRDRDRDVNVGSHEIPVGSANESFSRDRWRARNARQSSRGNLSRSRKPEARIGSSLRSASNRARARARHQSAIRRSRDRFLSIPYCHIAFALGRVAALTRGKSHRPAREGDL